MTALDIVLEKYVGTEIEANKVNGLKNIENINDLDCNCIDCGDDSDCSTPW